MKKLKHSDSAARLVSLLPDARIVRMVLAALAVVSGKGGLTRIANVTSIHRSTLIAGRKDLAAFEKALLTADILACGMRKEADKIAKRARRYSAVHEIAKSTALFIAETATRFVEKAAIAGISQGIKDSETLSAGLALIQAATAAIPTAISNAVNSGFGASLSCSMASNIAETAAYGIVGAAEEILQLTVFM